MLDFTSIRNLFGAADPKTVAFLVTQKPPVDRHRISHLTFRRTFGTKQKIAFEADHYDWHSVPQAVAVNDLFIWRANLLGGGRLVSLSQRFRSLQTLADFVESKSLQYGEGFTVAKGTHEAPFLTGMQFVPSSALTDVGVDKSQLSTVPYTHFERPRTESLYQSPLILFRKIETLPVAYWDHGPLAFTSKVIGLSAGTSSVRLKSVFTSIANRHRTFRLCAVLHGSQAFVAKATALAQQDIDLLPFPDDMSELDLSFWEEAIRDDVLDYMCSFVRRGQNSRLLKVAATEADIAKYSELFSRMLKTVYGTLRPHRPVFLNGLACQPFCFGEDPPALREEQWLESLQKLVFSEEHASMRTVRVVRFYLENTLLVIKPDRLRYWIPSTAIHDADDTLVDMRRQGY